MARKKLDSAVITLESIKIEMNDGKVISGRADFGKGSPSNPMSDAELSEKFLQCAGWGGLNNEQAQAVLDRVWKIETISDVTELTRLLRR